MSERPLGLHLKKSLSALPIKLARLVMPPSSIAGRPLIGPHLGATDLPKHRLRTTAAIIVRPEINSALPVHAAARNQHVAKVARLIAATDPLPPPRRRVLDRVVHRSVPVRICNRPMRTTHDLLERRIPREVLNSRGNSPRRENAPPRRRSRLRQLDPIRNDQVQVVGQTLLLVQVRSDRSRRVLVLPAPPRKNLMQQIARLD